MKYPISAQRILDCLHEYNMSAQDLSNKTGLNKASISQYVNGKNVPNNVNAGKIAEVFDVKPAWIMGFDVPQKEKTFSNSPIDIMYKDILIREVLQNSCELSDLYKTKLVEYSEMLLKLQSSENKEKGKP